MRFSLVSFLFFTLIACNRLLAQPSIGTPVELNSGWVCRQAAAIAPKSGGAEIAQCSYNTNGWMPATVPGTVLTTLVNNKVFPDPFFGFNNSLIPDIYYTGRDYYTYWFVNDFAAAPPINGGQIWLNFRGVNYSFKAFINGKEITTPPTGGVGMYLRHTYNITKYLDQNGKNRLAVIVYPPDPVGNPNGGQGGDGTIAKNVTNQYVAGWDWIQPIHDRNTGIWDKVTLEETGPVKINDPHIVTLVKGVRNPEQTNQQPATLKVTAELENASSQQVAGILQYTIDGNLVKKQVSIPANTVMKIQMPDFEIKNPRLWWPNGMGGHPLYTLKMQFTQNNKQIVDVKQLSFGVRDLKGVWNKHTKSREVQVNGQKVFIKGGNWIASDAMLRLSKERYDAELRMHRDMNLNLIRVWGGGITERPEFYDACDKYGLLVMQDFWVSGDCNGRWQDAFKKDDTLARRKYPEDHNLFKESLADQIKMLRNHPSLAIWCGGNEIAPPNDILKSLKDTLLQKLDGTRIFFAYSNHDSMSFQSHDGPYTLQPDSSFFGTRSFPFNSEVGSVGIGDFESLERFMPTENFILPKFNPVTQTWDIDTLWKYHKYTSYDFSVQAYGQPTSVADFCKKAQLVNYNQYRALMEGFSVHQWDWYTGTIIWKTQNPWTAMVGQMYDYYLDPNACMYGVSEGAKPQHVLYNPVTRSVNLVTGYQAKTASCKLTIKVIDMVGKDLVKKEQLVKLKANNTEPVFSFGDLISNFTKKEGAFLCLTITDSAMGYAIDENLYWLPDSTNHYSGLEKMPPAKVKPSLRILEPGLAELTIANPKDNPIAFFTRVALVDPKTRKRILPVFYSNNYISILPGQQKTILLEYKAKPGNTPLAVIEGWNVAKEYISGI